MPDGLHSSESQHKSLESGVMRKYHAPFGGRPTEKDYLVVPRRRPTLPNRQRGNLTLVGNTSLYRRQRKPQNIFRSVVRLVRWAMRSDLIEGEEWEA